MSNTAPLYELVLAGAAAQDEVSLRRLRAALVTEIELPVEEAKRALTSSEAVLRRSVDCHELEEARDILIRAGAAVTIRPSAPEGASNTLVVDAATGLDSPAGLDPLDQISDLFRDLSEHGVHAGSSLAAQPALPSAIADAETHLAARSGRVSHAPRPHWWTRVVSIPEICFSVGFSCLIIIVTALFRG